MAAPHIEAAAMIVARGDHRGDFVALDGAKRRVSVMIAQVRHMPPRRGDMTTPVIAVQKAGAIIAAGPAIRDQPVEMIACIEREPPQGAGIVGADAAFEPRLVRSEEHTSELQSLMRISYAVFCLQTKNHSTHTSQ